MPTVEEMRRWLKGERVDGLPERKGSWEVGKAELSDVWGEKRVCPECDGQGGLVDIEVSSLVQTCSKCKGSGWIEPSEVVKELAKLSPKIKKRMGVFKEVKSKNPRDVDKVKCVGCKGSGIHTDGTICSDCAGEGKLLKPATPLTKAIKKKLRKVEDSTVETFEAVGKYTVSEDGDDAMLHFGKHKGMLLSDIAKLKDELGYLLWLTKSDFPSELKGIADHVRRKRLKGKVFRKKKLKRTGKIYP